MIDFATIKPWIRPTFACLGILTLSNCADQNSQVANDPLGTGPFDSQGNYREDWADDPTKWRKPASRKTPSSDLPAIAANERPPANASPLPPARSTPVRPATTTPSRPATTAAKPQPKPVAAKPKPQPKPVAAKPKPKPKPTVTRYTVKAGDNLWSIANRNKTTVAAIQRANGISGSMIRPGQSLVIPKP